MNSANAMWLVSWLLGSACTSFADLGWYRPSAEEFARQYPFLSCEHQNECRQDGGDPSLCEEGDDEDVRFYSRCPEDYDAQAAGECLAQLSADVTWGGCDDDRCGTFIPWSEESAVGGCMSWYFAPG